MLTTDKLEPMLTILFSNFVEACCTIVAPDWSRGILDGLKSLCESIYAVRCAICAVRFKKHIDGCAGDV